MVQSFFPSTPRCLLFATVDLPRQYGTRLAPGEELPHFRTLLDHPAVDGIRINLTKPWDKEDAAAAIQAIKAAGKLVMADVLGKPRLVPRRGGTSVPIASGQILTVDARQGGAPGSPPFICTRPLDLQKVRPGQPVVIRDRRVLGHVQAVNPAAGAFEIRIDWTDAPDLVLLAPPVNFPGCPAVRRTPDRSDEEWMAFAVRERAVDYLALSFVETVEDVGSVLDLVTRLTADRAGPRPTLVLKIETAQGVENLPQILNLLGHDPEMRFVVEVARGDLDNEVDLDLGWAQERCFAIARERGVPVGVATGLLASLRTAPHASRAEKLDVWHALRQGASFLVLTDETANEAQYPLRAVETAAGLIARAEETTRIRTKGRP